MPKLINFYADDETAEYLNNLPQRERSKFIREALSMRIEKLNSPENKLMEANKLIDKANELKQNALEQKNIQKTQINNKYNNLKDAQIIFINNARKTISKNCLTKEGQFLSYKNTFGNITKSDFEDLLKNLIIPEELKNKSWILEE